VANPSRVLDPPRGGVVQTRRVLIAIAAAASLLVAVVYAFAVRSGWGQRLDAAAVKGRRVLSRHDLHVATRLHTTIDVVSLVLLGTAIVLVALLRRRPRLAIGAGTVIVGSLATTEALKRLLGRPDFGVVDVLKHMPSYPSGHTTIAMALSVTAMFVAPRRWRAPVATLGALFASAIGCSVVATASHRPSDPIGAALVVTAWSAAVAATLLRVETGHSRTLPTWLQLSPWMALGGIALLVASFVAVAISVVAVHYGHVDTIAIGRVFVAASSAIVGTILICTAALIITLHDADLDKPPRPNSASQGLNDTGR
jgi:membrane-associated phospholipid phosphatase